MLLPLAAAALAFGIALGLATPGEIAGATVVLVGVASMVAAVRRRRVIAMIAVVLAAGEGLGWWAARRPTLPDVVAHGVALGPAVSLSGRVTRGPDPVDSPRGRSWRVRVDTDRVAGEPARVSVALTGDEVPPALAPGDHIAANVRLREPARFLNPGDPDPARAMQIAGVDVYGTFSAGLRVVDAGRWFAPRRLAHRARTALRNAIESRLTGGRAALLRTAVLGERSAVDADTEAGFRAAGATHALSVSGLHLAIVALLFYGAVRTLLARVRSLALWLEPARAASLLAMPAVVFYTLLTGEAVATWRSAWMALALFGARALARPPSLSCAIAFAAVALLVASPWSLLDVSFQLSFASVIALGAFARHLSGDERNGGGWRRIVAWVRRSGAASVSAGLVTAPMVAHAFSEVAVAAPVGNLVLAPMVELLLVPLGLAAAIAAAVFPAIGSAALRAAAWATALTVGAAAPFARWAPILRVPTPGAFETALWTVGVFAALAAWTRPARRRAFVAAAVLCFVLAGAHPVARWIQRVRARSVTVTFLDVGQGDAALIEGPRGFVALVDGGGLPGTSIDVGARVLEPLLRRRGITSIDLVVLSHPHPDHMAGLLHVLARFPVRALWTSGDARHPDYARLIALANEHRVALAPPATFEREGVVLEPLGPWNGDAVGAPDGLSVNDASLTVRLRYAGHTILFAGDLEADGETELVGRFGDRLAADVLKVPHHGSRTSSTPEMIAAVRPQLAIISCGRGNRFGFPRAEVLERYRSAGVRVFRTDRDGAVTVTLTESGELDATCTAGCR